MVFDYRHCTALIAAAAVSVSALAAAQTPSSSAPESAAPPAEEAAESRADAAADESTVVRYTGSVVRSMPNTRPFELRVNQWSSEGDREAVARLFQELDDPATVAEALSKMPVIGGFRTIDGRANPIRYAEEVTAADGTRKLLILSDRRVDYWEGDNAPSAVAEGYTLMEIRFNGENGEGIATHGAEDIVVDEATSSLGISDFDEQPSELIGVTRVEAGEGFELDEMMDDVLDAVGIE